MTFEVVHGNVLKFVADYQGPKFHVLLADPPYHLTSIVARFQSGELDHTQAGQDILKRATPMARLARGFLGKSWDTDVAFRPETWRAISSVLHPGALMMVYAGSRGYHRMATAMEDSGLIIHPAIGWVKSTGLAKGTRIDTQAFRHPEGSADLARAWAGHRYNAQALKPALEFVAVAQVPFGQKPIDAMLSTGAGAYNLEAGRLPPGSPKPNFPVGHERTWFDKTWKPRTADPNPGVRVPSNFAVVHLPECRMTHVKVERPSQMGLFAETLIAPGQSTYVQWSCIPGCPVMRLTEEAGRDDSVGEYFFQAHWAYEQLEKLEGAMPAGYAPRSSRAEREAGLEALEAKPYDKVYGTMQDKQTHTLEAYEYESDPIRNTHPTAKNISFNRWLANLLLPPALYAPRRLFNPFMGVASEAIGAALAGFEEVVGVELEAEYIPIANERLKFWTQVDKAQLELFDA